MKRIVCLDIGDVRIGVAVSDPTGTIATPLEVIRRRGWGPDCRRVKEICDRYGTDEVLSGLPLNMDGSEGFQAEKVREFCDQLKKHGLKIQFQDERLTTVTAEEALLEDGMSRKERRNHVDKVAAAVILRQWLDEKNQEEKQMEENPGNLYDEEMNGESMNDEEFDGMIELTDEEGNTEQFELLASFPIGEQQYLAVSEPIDEESEESVEVLFLRVEEDGENGDTYIPVDDEEEADTVYEMFLKVIGEDAPEE